MLVRIWFALVGFCISLTPFISLLQAIQVPQEALASLDTLALLAPQVRTSLHIRKEKGQASSLISKHILPWVCVISSTFH